MHPLRELRSERDLSQEELADLAGVSQDSVSRIERGTNLVYGTAHFKVAAALGVPVSNVLDAEQCNLDTQLDWLVNRLGLDYEDPDGAVRVLGQLAREVAR